MTDPRAPLSLEVLEPGEDEPATFLLSAADAVIGRDPGCDVLLDEPSISGRHGVLQPGRAGWTYRDLGSSNGSALVKAGGAAPAPAAPGEPVTVGPGDVLLLGDARRPVRIALRRGAAAFAPAPAPTRTVVASSPLADLLAGGGASADEALDRLAAQALASDTAEELAEAAVGFLRAIAPRAAAHGAAVWGAGVAVAAGDAIPGAIREAAAERGEVVLFEEGGEALPQTASVARTGVKAALAAPALARGGSYGVLAAWTPLGAAALPAGAMGRVSVAASLVALSAAQLAVRLEGARRREELEAENRRLRGGRAEGLRVIEPVGESPAFLKAVDLARSVAPSDVPVLIRGETGTGKEVLARNLHLWSRRAERPFVAFNCAAVPEALIESELFGHVRGAFTGAGADRKGLFEEADGGTIFLDEIGEMPAVMQAKLLRVLQDGEVRRVGASRSARVDVRVVSATHRDLVALVGEGRFRADLMYRLNAVTMQIPALRERGDDVTLLAHFLLGRACDQARKRVPGFSPGALWALARHDFPGNVRELENEVLRAVALTSEGRPIEASAFSERVADKGPPPAVAAAVSGGAVALKDAVAATERAVIEAALERCGGNVSQAARELGVTRPGLYKVMDRLGMR